MGPDSIALVLAGGEQIRPEAARHVPVPATVIAADSGLHQAEQLGLVPDVVVGDMDSVRPEALEAARLAGAEIVRHPADKDATDLELALQWARAGGHRRIIVLGGSGGRIDHLLGNALVLTSEEFADHRVEWWVGSTRIVVVREEAVIDGTPGDLVTLLAVSGPGRGIRTSGLRWSLDDEDLPSGSTRGVSNEMTAATARITVASGVLLAVHTPRSGDTDAPPKP